MRIALLSILLAVLSGCSYQIVTTTHENGKNTSSVETYHCFSNISYAPITISSDLRTDTEVK